MPDTPSSPHRAVSKNGKDRQQDRELAELHSQVDNALRNFQKFQESEDRWKLEDRATHAQLIRSVTRQNVLIGIAAGVFSMFIAWLGTLWVKIDNVEERLEEQHKSDQLRNDQHAYKGEEWGRTMERDIAQNRKELREIERRLFGRNGMNGRKNGE